MKGVCIILFINYITLLIALEMDTPGLHEHINNRTKYLNPSVKLQKLNLFPIQRTLSMKMKQTKTLH